MYQSQRVAACGEGLDRLLRQDLVYPCTCSRKQLAGTAGAAFMAWSIPALACERQPCPAQAALWLWVPPGRIVFEDGLQGRVACEVAAECGDFVLRRADGVWSYQLAVVVDDAQQGITHVVRGADLLAPTPRQIVQQRLLGLPTPAPLHLPVVLDAPGDMLSKQGWPNRPMRVHRCRCCWSPGRSWASSRLAG